VRSFLLLLEKAAVPQIRFHDLRHTAATLLSAHVNPKVVSEMLGHSSVSITLAIYSHVLPDMQQGAAAAMAQLLFAWVTISLHHSHGTSGLWQDGKPPWLTDSMMCYLFAAGVC